MALAHDVIAVGLASASRRRGSSCRDDGSVVTAVTFNALVTMVDDTDDGLRVRRREGRARLVVESNRPDHERRSEPSRRR